MKSLYNSNYYTVIVAGGTSNRFGQNKLLLKLKNMPVLLHSIKKFAEICMPENIIVIANNDYLQLYKELIHTQINNKIIIKKGGETRAKSVFNGLDAIKENEKGGMVAIHDAARPLISKQTIIKAFEYCKEYGSCVIAKKITDTIKYVDNNIIEKTLDREKLWAVETPQLFKLQDIKNAYTEIIKKNINITDDASAMEYCNKKVYILENKLPNLKITYQEDIILAETIIKQLDI